MRPFCAQVFLALLLFAGVASAQEPHRVFRVPFHTVNSMILLDAKVNGKPAALLLDTGAQFTLVSAKAANLVVNLHTFEMTAHGARGEYVKHRVVLDLPGIHSERMVLIVDLRETTKQFGTPIDGYIGQDMLREFQAVRIDYKANVVELEEKAGGSR